MTLTLNKDWNWRGEFFAVMLFVIFDSLILIMNYQITYEMDKNALDINVAGRQRMLTQQQAKVLLEIKYRLDRDLPVNKLIGELKRSHEMFSESMSAFAYGGTIIGPNNQDQFINKIDDEIAQSIIDQALIDMTPISWIVSQFFDGFHISNIDFDLAIRTAVKQGEYMLLEMNKLTTRIQQLSNNKTQRLRLVQSIVFGAALMNFMFILWLFKLRIKNSSDSIESLTHLINSIDHAILGVDNRGKINFANDKAMQLFGYSKQMLTTLVQDTLITQSMDSTMGVRSDGGKFHIEVQNSSINIFGRILRLVEIRDISKQWKSQIELTRMASRDALTDTVNRRVLFDRLELEVEHAARDKTLLGVIFIDLDHFKPVNDNYGHSVGDQLLKEVAARIKSRLRANDTLSRYGGDEFVVLLSKLADEKNLEDMAKTIIDIISKPYQIKKHAINIGASLGLAYTSGSKYSGLELLHFADHAMYQAKRRLGGNNYVMSLYDVPIDDDQNMPDRGPGLSSENGST